MEEFLMCLGPTMLEVDPKQQNRGFWVIATENGGCAIIGKNQDRVYLYKM